MLLSCVNRFLLEAHGKEFEVKKVAFCTLDLENFINLKKIEFASNFCLETGCVDKVWAEYIADFIITICRFKKKMPTYYSYILEDFLQIDLINEISARFKMKDLYVKMIQYTGREYAKTFGKEELEGQELFEALQEWAGGY